MAGDLRIEESEAMAKQENFRQEVRWKSIEALEVAVLDYLHGCRAARIYSALGCVPPCEYQRRHLSCHAAPSCAA